LFGPLIVSDGGNGFAGAMTLTEVGATPVNLKFEASGGLAIESKSSTEMVAPGPRFNKALRGVIHVHPNVLPKESCTEKENIEEHLDVSTSWSKKMEIETPLASNLVLVIEGGRRYRALTE